MDPGLQRDAWLGIKAGVSWCWSPVRLDGSILEDFGMKRLEPGCWRVLGGESSYVDDDAAGYIYYYCGGESLDLGYCVDLGDL